MVRAREQARRVQQIRENHEAVQNQFLNLQDDYPNSFQREYLWRRRNHVPFTDMSPEFPRPSYIVQQRRRHYFGSRNPRYPWWEFDRRPWG